MRRGTERAAKASTASILSSLWVVVFLNMVFRDIHEIVTREFLEEALARTVSDELLLVAGIALEIPILMVVLAKLLPPLWSRRANMAVAVLTVPLVFANPPGDLDDIWFVGMQVLVLVAILWISWRWPVSDASRRDAGTASPQGGATRFPPR